MIYTIIIVLITALLITLSVLAEKKQNLTRSILYINLILSIFGVTLIICAHLIANSKLNLYLYDEAFHSWASDFYELYYLISFPAFILLFVTNTLAALVRPTEGKKGKYISKLLRIIVSIASSVLLLIIPYYGLFTQNNNLKLYIYIMISGVGQALIIRLADMLRLMMQIRKS